MTATKTRIVQTIRTSDGEIVVYRDHDGYHAEVWSESRQLIVAQSGDCRTKEAALNLVGYPEAY